MVQGRINKEGSEILHDSMILHCSETSDCSFIDEKLTRLYDVKQLPDILVGKVKLLQLE